MRAGTETLSNKASFVYDDFGHVIKQTDALGHATHWVYDSHGQTIRRESPNSHIVEWEYDHSRGGLLIRQPADLVNGIIYDARGDKVNAGLSYAAAILFVGWGATIGKFANKAVDGAADFAKETVGGLRAAGKKDAHHIIQDAAVRDLPGYNTNAAPGIQLPDPSNVVGTPYNLATAVQRQAGGGTYGAERRIGYKALRQAGISEDEARAMIQQADEYFGSIGVGPNTVTRIPGKR